MSNGNGDECEWCEDGHYWDCGPEPRCEDDPGLQGPELEDWTLIGEVTLQANTTYYVKCRPGCDARVDENGDVTLPWRLVGTVVPGKPGEGPAGTYNLFCRKGGGQACYASLVPA